MKHLILLCILGLCVAANTFSQTPSVTQNYVQVQTYRGSSSSQPVTSIDYLDGLGRPIQSVTHQGSPMGKDLITKTTTYDAVGREEKTYLLTPDTLSNGAFLSALATQASRFYGDNTPFTQPIYEASPLNRVVAQYGAGAAWRVANRAMRSSYQVNMVNEVRRWERLWDSSIGSQEFYLEGELSKLVVSDEEHHQVIEYKDQLGRVIEKRVEESTTPQGVKKWLVTCYVYDQMQRLIYVLPPQYYATKVETASGEIRISESVDSEQIYIYHYDSRGRVTEKNVPGGGWTHLVYNRMGQVILSQNARQREEEKWTFSKYDALGRVVLAGEKVFSDQNRHDLQTASDQASVTEESVQYETRSATDTIWEYSNVSYPPVAAAEVNVVNYYDDYSWQKGNIGFLPFEELTQQPTSKGLATGGKVRLLDGSGTMLTSVVYYDNKNRVVQTHQQNPFGGVTRTDLSLNFAGEVLQKRVVNSYTDGKPNYTTLTEYEYDQMGRKTKTRHAVLASGQTEAQAEGVTLAEYVYDEVGRLVAKRIQPSETGYQPLDGLPAQVVRNQPVSGDVTDKATTEIVLGEGFSMTEGSTYTAQVVGGTSGQVASISALQVMDYTYNIRGWMKSINGGTLNRAENDLFGFKLNYEDQPGGYYNGNIHKQSWVSHSAKDSPARSYTYSYDAANRITAAQYTGGKYMGENYSLSGMQYDKNSNIVALTRSGMKTGTPTTPTSFGIIDQLSYAYQNGGNSNKLASVTDAMITPIPEAVGDFRDKHTAGDDYDYYADGSLKEDKNKGITSIVYNYLGLVEKVVVSEGANQGTINYVYDGSGRKWRKVVYDQTKQITTKTDYDQEIEFADNKLSFILHEEGRVIPEPQTGKLVYEYHYKDHLGNLRVAFRQRNQSQTKASLTLEPVLAASEEASFANVDESRVAGEAHSGRYSARVKGIGPAKQVQLEAGEKLQVKVYGHVEAEGKHKISFLPLPVLGDVPAGGESGKRKLAIKGGVLIPLNWGSKNGSQPAAYLEIVASDTSGKVVHAERKSLSHAASESWEELSIDYQAQGAETVVIQLVNPSEIAIVHFDDLSISQEPPLIVQENHYDPWGLNLTGIEVQGTPEHHYQYNGIEREKSLALNWDMAQYRAYDAQLGRFHVIDPVMKEHESPYAWNTNNPIMYPDPDGADSLQRANALAKAKQYVDGNKSPGAASYVMGAKGQPGSAVDCSGMISMCVKAGSEKDPNRGTATSGVVNIENNSTPVSEKDLEPGNLVSFRKPTGYAYHIGVVTKVERDSKGNITTITMKHSSSGKGPNLQSFSPSDKKSYGSWIHGYYKWDTKPDPPKADLTFTPTMPVSSQDNLRSNVPLPVQNRTVPLSPVQRVKLEYIMTGPPAGTVPR